MKRCRDEKTMRRMLPALAVTALAGLTNCGVEVGEAEGTPKGERAEGQLQSAQLLEGSGLRSAAYHIGPVYSDPGFGWICLRVEVDDAEIRRKHPSFDGLETVYADLPGLGRFRLKYMRTADGFDVHYTEAGYQDGAEHDVRQRGVTFGLWTNVGDLQHAARGKDLGPQIREWPVAL